MGRPLVGSVAALDDAFETAGQAELRRNPNGVTALPGPTIGTRRIPIFGLLDTHEPDALYVVDRLGAIDLPGSRRAAILDNVPACVGANPAFRQLDELPALHSGRTFQRRRQAASDFGKELARFVHWYDFE